MAKTVFGMPNKDDKDKAGAPTAPGGVPGAKSEGALPQKPKEAGDTDSLAPQSPQAAPQPGTAGAAPTEMEKPTH